MRLSSRNPAAWRADRASNTSTCGVDRFRRYPAAALFASQNATEAGAVVNALQPLKIFIVDARELPNDEANYVFTVWEGFVPTPISDAVIRVLARRAVWAAEWAGARSSMPDILCDIVRRRGDMQNSLIVDRTTGGTQ
jgi:hypothetical protein